jgi:transglutaminase-like putative cysteine protease
MPIRVALAHRTSYRFDRPSRCRRTIRLRPAPHCRTPILGYSLHVSPAQHFINWQQDPYGNWIARVVFPERTDHLRVTVDLTADLTIINPFDFFVEPYAETFPFAYSPILQQELAPFLEVEPPGDRLLAWIERFRTTKAVGLSTVNLLVAVNQCVKDDVAYLVRMEPGVQTPEETLTKASGSCRDSGWLLVQILRHLGIAARFASGYLIQLVADVKPLEGPVRTATSPICTRGRRPTFPVLAGSDSTRRRGSSPAKATFRSPVRRRRAAPHRSPGSPISRTSSST